MSDLSKRTKLSYIPATDTDRAEMLEAVGVPDIDTIFEQIPAEAKMAKPYDLPQGLSEQDIVALMEELSSRNKNLGELVSFLGAGAYDHFVPSVVDAIISRSEFYTAYTPYQPEASQGVLQSIYEYQSTIAALTQMDMSNASLYDGGTAVGEVAIMATATTNRKRIIVSKAVHPNYREVLTTYTADLGIEIAEIDFTDGVTNLDALKKELSDTSAAVIVQYPNFFGSVEDLAAIGDAARAAGAMFIVVANPISLGLLTPPGAYGADIVVGEGQPLGIPIGFGGPYLGFFACKQEHMWKMPGRIVGATVDTEGRTAYTLTLQTREQHIRREKATSNICTNEALIALAATVYLAALGKNGLMQVADLCFQKAHYANKQIVEKTGCSGAWNAPFFNEFVVKTNKPVAEINKTLLENGILGGLDLGKFYPELENHMLICTTEKRTKAQIDRLVELLS